MLWFIENRLASFQWLILRQKAVEGVKAIKSWIKVHWQHEEDGESNCVGGGQLPPPFFIQNRLGTFSGRLLRMSVHWSCTMRTFSLRLKYQNEQLLNKFWLLNFTIWKTFNTKCLRLLLSVITDENEMVCGYQNIWSAIKTELLEQWWWLS